MILDRPSKPTISGPLQEKIMILLRERSLCGKDLMNELGLKSPGTIYPVLEELRRKEMIDFQLETLGAIRKKTYDLTAKGKKYLRESMTSSAKMFCCDSSLYIETVLRDAKGIIDIRRHQKVLSTLDYVDLRRFLNGADVTYSTDVDDMGDRYDVILSFTGVGCLIGRTQKDLPQYFASLRSKLRKGGQLLVVEIERTDNLFATIFFKDIRNMSKLPGMSSKELEDILSKAGFNHVVISPKSGLLYGLARYY
jgi:DNA-binding PadR family transcriptional regulator